jgi:hypothetical protein
MPERRRGHDFLVARSTTWDVLDHRELEAHLGRYDPELLTHTWTAADRKPTGFRRGSLRWRGRASRPAS